MADWQWFVTLTFRDPSLASGQWTRPGWGYAKRAWDDFVQYVRPPVGELKWFRAFEMQRDRGVPHIHGLIAGLSTTSFTDASAFLWQRYGFCRILDYNPRLGAAHYITKYVTKELGDFAFSPSIHAKH